MLKFYRIPVPLMSLSAGSSFYLSELSSERLVILGYNNTLPAVKVFDGTDSFYLTPFAIVWVDSTHPRC